MGVRDKNGYCESRASAAAAAARSTDVSIPKVDEDSACDETARGSGDDELGCDDEPSTYHMPVATTITPTTKRITTSDPKPPLFITLSQARPATMSSCDWTQGANEHAMHSRRLRDSPWKGHPVLWLALIPTCRAEKTRLRARTVRGKTENWPIERIHRERIESNGKSAFSVVYATRIEFLRTTGRGWLAAAAVTNETLSSLPAPTCKRATIADKIYSLGSNVATNCCARIELDA